MVRYADARKIVGMIFIDSAKSFTLLFKNMRGVKLQSNGISGNLAYGFNTTYQKTNRTQNNKQRNV